MIEFKEICISDISNIPGSKIRTSLYTDSPVSTRQKAATVKRWHWERVLKGQCGT